MAIRLRLVDGAWKAFCAAQEPAQEGDEYLHDGLHDALTEFYFDNYDINGPLVVHTGNVDLEQEAFAAGLRALEAADNAPKSEVKLDARGLHGPGRTS